MVPTVLVGPAPSQLVFRINGRIGLTLFFRVRRTGEVGSALQREDECDCPLLRLRSLYKCDIYQILLFSDNSTT